MISGKKQVMVFGAFDIFHPGHKNFLKQAKARGDYLLVVIARDATIKKLKKRPPRNSERRRLVIFKKSQLADRVLLGDQKNPYKLIKRIRPDIICLGYDQKFYAEGLKDKLKKLGLENIKVLRMKPFQPEKYKSSKLIL